VRFEVAEPFTTVTYCHCTTCKKLSGGAGTVNGRTSSATIRIVQGAELLRTYQPSEGSSKTFCSECGTNLFGGGWPESEQSSVRLPALEEPPDRGPEAHIWVRSVAPWETLPEDGLERFETGRP
jgi:hypothetical protein